MLPVHRSSPADSDADLEMIEGGGTLRCGMPKRPPANDILLSGAH